MCGFIKMFNSKCLNNKKVKLAADIQKTSDTEVSTIVYCQSLSDPSYWNPSNSTSKTRVELGGMQPGTPEDEYFVK